MLSDWGELDRKITSMRIQKPGLALSGFVKHVFPDRIQVLGLTEIDYLLSCSPEQARAGLGRSAASRCAVWRSPAASTRRTS